MSEESLDEVRALFTEALALRPEDRPAFLDSACRDDPALRQEVDELLGLEGEAARFFDGLSGDIAHKATLEVESAARPRIQIGPYRLLEAVGRGGMGVVYRAERVDGSFDQKVALKLLHRDMETPELKARFLAERQLLAHLSHPNIARLQDGGVTDEGRPYFVMEYVEGQPVTRHCRESRLSVEAILRLFLVIVDAVGYLHRNLVVHRDLKPSNVFVDCEGHVKLLDFGIAKLLADAPEGEAQTRTGERLMTPSYASPEQLQGAPVTTATDVYALGVTLYELLTGRRPHESGRSTASPELPPPPSSALRSSSSSDGWRRLKGDLDDICLKALRPEPEARYASAELLGQDIQRHIAGLPVQASRGSFAYRLGKFTRRHKRSVLAAAALAILVVGGFTRERSLRTEAEQARVDAQREAAKSAAASRFLAELLSSVDPDKAQGKEVSVADVLDQTAEKLAAGTELSREPSVEAAVRLTVGNTYVALGKYPEALSHLERAVELVGGRDSTDVEALAAIADLGVVYERLARYDEAERLLRRVLEVRTETLGEDDPDSLAVLNRLANLLFAAGRFDEVEPLDRKTLEIRRRVLGADHPDTLRTLNGLAATLFTTRRFAEAAPLFEEALEVQRRQLGESHPDTLMLGNNLAATYLELGRYPEAESLLGEVIDGRSLVLGPEHEDTVMSIHNLGVALVQQARFGEAEQELKRAAAVRQRQPGETKSFLFSSSHLADVYREQGRFREAQELYASVLEGQRDGYGPDDIDALRTMTGLAILRIVQDDLTAAENLLEQVRDSLLRAHGEEHPDAVQLDTLMARIRNEQARFAEAQELSERAIQSGTRDLGPDHRVVLDAAYERARALVAQGQPDAARTILNGILARRTTILGEHHPDTRKTRQLIGRLSGSERRVSGGGA